YLLVELPHEIVPPRVEETLFRLRAKGLAPILTHPERNGELLTKGGVDRIAQWVERGLLVQVTGESLTGGFGPRPRDMGVELVRRGLCHFVATDAHSATWRRPALGAAREVVERIARQDLADRLLSLNPGRVVRNERL